MSWILDHNVMQAAFSPNPPALMGASCRLPGVPWLAQTANPFVYGETDGWQSPQNECEWRGFYQLCEPKSPFPHDKSKLQYAKHIGDVSLVSLSFLFLFSCSFYINGCIHTEYSCQSCFRVLNMVTLTYSWVINESDNHAFHDFQHSQRWKYELCVI